MRGTGLVQIQGTTRCSATGATKCCSTPSRWRWPRSGKVLRKECRDELTAAIHKLELEVAELPGELKGMREDRRADSVVELPRSAWRHNAA
jgi:hypothetical protein